MFAILNAKVPGAMPKRAVAAVKGGFVRAKSSRSRGRGPLGQQVQPVESWAHPMPLGAMTSPPMWTPPFTPPERRDLGVGILAAEVYVPTRFVAQSALEAADGVGEGKYTVGLGQSRLAFMDDREDINSMCLTAVQGLMDKFGISARDIGRIDVGTETLVDKSKSTKTTIVGHLMGKERNVEGATSINACYGGTAALLNSIAWVESSEWDGRYAIMVAADIAVYEAGPARPTGGAGAVAVLIGPDAALKMVPDTRFTHTADVYDFYKPLRGKATEYPTVDGRLSQACYIRAVDDCYQGALAKVEARARAEAAGEDASLAAFFASAEDGSGEAPLTVGDAFDHLVFHSPYNKLVQQSYHRLLFNDAVRLLRAGQPLPEELEPLRKWVEPTLAGGPEGEAAYEASLVDRDLGKALAALGKAGYSSSVGPSTDLSRNIGNSYAAAVYANLVSLISTERAALEGRRVGVFSYGSGAIATMFAMEGSRPAGDGFSLDEIADTIALEKRLAARREADVDEYLAAMAMREHALLSGDGDFTPVGSLDNVRSGEWYLERIDGRHIRHYARKE